MKRSNIIIICTALLFITWSLISGWLQANAYNIIKKGKTCSYAKVSGEENVYQYKPFRNISFVAEKMVVTPLLSIKYGNKSEMSFSKNIDNAIFSNISGDTLYLKMGKKTNGMSAYINIRLPLLNSVNIKITPDTTSEYRNSGLSTIISGFKGNSLSINNMGQNSIRLFENQLKKLVIKGNFYKGKEIEISKSTECDSLDIDVEGQDGSLLIGNSYFTMKENPIKWTRIVVPGSFRVTSSASIASKIILKK